MNNLNKFTDSQMSFLKGNAVRFQDMKLYGRDGGTAPLILNLGTRWGGQLHASAALAPRKNPARTDYEARWDSAPV